MKSRITYLFIMVTLFQALSFAVPRKMHLINTLRKETSTFYKQINKSYKLHIIQIDIILCPENDSLFVAHCITDKLADQNWWSEFFLFKQSKGKIQWVADIDSASIPTGCAINSIKWVKLKGFSSYLLEVFDQTHRGNGYFYLYELKDRKLDLLFKTRAVDFNLEDDYDSFYSEGVFSATFKNDRLFASYKDLNKDGYSDIVLSGTINYYGLEDRKIIRRQHCKKAYLYSPEEHRFIPDNKARIGCDYYDKHFDDF